MKDGGEEEEKDTKCYISSKNEKQGYKNHINTIITELIESELYIINDTE